jgi:indole-3-glycerol phosphate synthase
MPAMTGGLLDAVVAGARRSAAERARLGRVVVERAAAGADPSGVTFRAALAAPGPRVIAECKRRSPSAGVLRRDYRPAEIAAGYARAGAAAISVLTEPTFFDGRLEHLSAVRARVGVPVLRKDFIVTEFQIVEARAAGADAVLLIARALEDRDLRTLVAAAAGYGLAALVETHSTDEVARAAAAGASIVGVNSRDLRTLATDPSVFERVAGSWPPDVIAVAESGIRQPADIRRLRHLGYGGFLIGERFMTAPDPGAALAAFIGELGEEQPS